MAVSGTEKPLSPVPCPLHSPPGQSTKPLAAGAPSRAETAPPRLPWSAEVLLEPHLHRSTEKDGPAWAGHSLPFVHRPGLGLALLQYECDDIYCDKPRLCTTTLLHGPKSQNDKCWVNPKACLSLHKSHQKWCLKLFYLQFTCPCVFSASVSSLEVVQIVPLSF